MFDPVRQRSIMIPQRDELSIHIINRHHFIALHSLRQHFPVRTRIIFIIASKLPVFAVALDDLLFYGGADHLVEARTVISQDRFHEFKTLAKL